MRVLHEACVPVVETHSVWGPRRAAGPVLWPPGGGLAAWPHPGCRRQRTPSSPGSGHFQLCPHHVQAALCLDIVHCPSVAGPGSPSSGPSSLPAPACPLPCFLRLPLPTWSCLTPAGLLPSPRSLRPLGSRVSTQPAGSCWTPLILQFMAQVGSVDAWGGTTAQA